MKHPAIVLAVAFVLALLGLAGWHWRGAWWPTADPPAPVATAPVPPPAATAPLPAAPPPAPASSAPRHPIEAASAAAEGPADNATRRPPSLESALAGLFSAETLATMLVTDDFARRVAVTVDNLGREKTPARLWPLSTPAGRFSPQAHGDGEVIGAQNHVRYARHIAFIEGLDMRRTVALYKRFYPQFQRAYEELGYPGRHFNDRLVDIIDMMLAVPEPATAPAVRVPAIQGPIQPQRPWLMYEFTEPAQQAAPAGVQLMLRMGPENRRRLKAKLFELRQLIARR